MTKVTGFLYPRAALFSKIHPFFDLRKSFSDYAPFTTPSTWNTNESFSSGDWVIQSG